MPLADSQRGSRRSRSRSAALSPRSNSRPAFTPFVFDATPDEVDVVGEIMRAGSFSTVNAMMRDALYRQARQLGVECPGDTFQLYIPKKRKQGG